MKTPAQERIESGPFGALLILLSLLLGSGSAVAAGGDIRQSARLSPSRQSASVALLPSGIRDALEDEALAAGGDPAAASCEPRVVTQRLRPNPAAGASIAHQVELPETAGPSHRARAPPAA